MSQDRKTKEVQNHAGSPEEGLADTQHVASEMAKAFQELARFVPRLSLYLTLTMSLGANRLLPHWRDNLMA